MCRGFRKALSGRPYIGFLQLSLERQAVGAQVEFESKS